MPTTSDLHYAAGRFLADSAFLDDFDDRLAAWLGDADDKIERIRAVAIATRDQLGEAKAHAEEWQQVVSTWTTRAARLTALAETLLTDREALGEGARVEGVARLQANGGKTPVLVLDEKAIPAAWRCAPQPPPPDLDRIRAALEAGTEIPGVVLGERGRHVRWE